MIDYEAGFAAALAHDEFLERCGSEEHRRCWAVVFDQFELTDAPDVPGLLADPETGQP